MNVWPPRLQRDHRQTELFLVNITLVLYRNISVIQ